MGKLFGTDGIRGLANCGDMTPAVAMQVGRAIAHYFNDEDAEVRSSIVMGRDPRLSGAMLEAALVAGICSVGVDVRLLGVVPTPAVALSAVWTGAVAGIVVSASHNPFYDNGIKVFKGDGFKLSDEEEEALEQLIVRSDFVFPVNEHVGTVYSVENGVEHYASFCVQAVPQIKPFEGLRLVLDCSNGATSVCAESIFQELGADVTVIHQEPDGININDACGSQHTEDLSEKVVALGAYAGLAFDGDGDRLIAVDEAGSKLSGDQMMAICAISLKSNGLLRSNGVVATVMSNVGFHASMRSAGIEVYTAGVGDRNVVSMMKENNAILGGEESGHMIFLDGHTTGDGIYSAIRLMALCMERQMPLSELARVMQPFPQVMINVDVKQKPPLGELDELCKAVAKAEIELGEQGRVLIRYSGTQWMCRVMVEGPEKEQTEILCRRLAKVVKESIG